MKKIIPFLLIVFLKVFADGAIIPPANYNQEIYSSDQIAVIKHFEGVEELTVLVKTSYYYSYQSFAWVIPLPSSPQVSEVNSDLFLNLADVSKPVYKYRPYNDFGCGTGGPYFGRGEGDEDYFIIEYANIYGFLSTVVINTNQADSLRSWLLNNGYSVNEEVVTLSQEYINNNWTHFFCARTTDTGEYNRNSLGVKLVFDSEEPVFPLKISRANYPSSGYYPGLYLYVISTNKMTFPNSELKYANKISAKELKEIQKDLPELGNYLKEGDYLTKLYKQYQSASEMKDITLVKAKDDKEYRELYSNRYYYYGMGMPIFPFFLFFLLLIMKLYYLIKKRQELKS
jgi:hypothetical protein